MRWVELEPAKCSPCRDLYSTQLRPAPGEGKDRPQRTRLRGEGTTRARVSLSFSWDCSRAHRYRFADIAERRCILPFFSNVCPVRTAATAPGPVATASSRRECFCRSRHYDRVKVMIASGVTGNGGRRNLPFKDVFRRAKLGALYCCCARQAFRLIIGQLQTSDTVTVTLDTLASIQICVT